MTRSELQLVSLATASASGRSPSPTRAGRDAAAVVAITALAFLPALRNGFVEFDDQQNILENPMFRGLGPGRIGWMFTTFHMGHWQPLSWVSLGLDYTLWGLDPLGYHLTNLVLHLTSAAVLFLLARCLLSRAGIPSPGVDAGAAIGALLWAVHPLRVESVVWITERRDVLSGLFVLLALLAWIQPADRRSRLPLTLVAAVLALLSKGSAMVLPVLFVVLDVYPLRRRPRGLDLLPFLALAGIGAAVAVVAAGTAGAISSLATVPPVQRIAAVMFNLGFYLWKTVLPIRLQPLYAYPSLTPVDPLPLAGAATAVGVAAAAWALRQRCPALAAAFAFHLAAVAPTLGLAQAGPQLAADRYTYIAGMAWGVLAAGALVSIVPRPRLVAAPFVLVLGLLTATYIPAWRDGRTLWTRAVAMDPENVAARLHLANVSQLAGDLDGAVAQIREVLRMRPQFAEAHAELAVLLTARREFDEALTHYRTALAIDPNPRAEVLSNMGVLLMRTGKPADAIPLFRGALGRRPDLPGIHENLAQALLMVGNRGEAIAELEAALRLDPGAAAARRALTAIRSTGTSLP